MFIFEDGKMVRKENISIDTKKKQIIFTSPKNSNLLKWLHSKNLPEQFFEDITNEDQSVAYDDWESVKLITLKYIFLQEGKFILYDEENISILKFENKVIFLSENREVIVEISKKFQKRFKNSDKIDLSIYKIIDILVDNVMLMINVIDESLETLEDNILAGRVDEEEVQKNIYKFNPLAYPFINNIDRYTDDYFKSKSSILILHGEPGGGKTSFIKYILNILNKNRKDKSKKLLVLYSFDENIFYSNELYNKMIIIDYDIIILEDMNNILYKNQDNNQNILAKFLSVTDGLLSKDTKIIISTNIESRSQINEALMRPGRSFNTIHFRKLKVEEVKALADSYNKKMNLRPMNISEFYANVNNEQNNKIINNTTGF